MGSAKGLSKAYYSEFITTSTLDLLGTVIQKKYQVTELPDDRADAYLVRGILRNSAGDGKLALQDLNRAVELSPTNAEVYFVRGIIRSSLGDQKGALIDCNSTVK